MAFDPGRHAAEVHALLEHAHRDGSGVAPFEVWWQALRGDAEYDPALVFLAGDPDGRVIGVAQCWTSAFVKDLAVTGHWQRRGVGAALLTHVFAAFRTIGAGHVDLKVEAGNATARRLYSRLGMHPVARRSPMCPGVEQHLSSHRATSLTSGLAASSTGGPHAGLR